MAFDVSREDGNMFTTVYNYTEDTLNELHFMVGRVVNKHSMKMCYHNCIYKDLTLHYCSRNITAVFNHSFITQNGYFR